MSDYRVLVLESASCLIIAELEDEQTHIVEVTIDDLSIVRSLKITEGETFEVSASPGQEVVVKGYYIPNRAPLRDQQRPRSKNELIAQFIKDTIRPRKSHYNRP